MRVTLAQYQLLSPAERASVTHIDASICDEADIFRAKLQEDWEANHLNDDWVAEQGA